MHTPLVAGAQRPFLTVGDVIKCQDYSLPEDKFRIKLISFIVIRGVTGPICVGVTLVQS